MTAWNTKRDGYRVSKPAAPLGKPVERLTPNEWHTHAISIPGTTFKLFINADKTDSGKLLKAIARTTVPGPFKRRVKASPVLMTIAEFHALNTERQAA